MHYTFSEAVDCGSPGNVGPQNWSRGNAVSVSIRNDRNVPIIMYIMINPDDASATPVGSILPGDTITLSLAGLVHVTNPQGDHLPIEGKCYILTTNVAVNVRV